MEEVRSQLSICNRIQKKKVAASMWFYFEPKQNNILYYVFVITIFVIWSNLSSYHGEHSHVPFAVNVRETI